MRDVFKTARQHPTAQDIELEDFLRHAERYQQGVQEQLASKITRKRKPKTSVRRQQKEVR